MWCQPIFTFHDSIFSVNLQTRISFIQTEKISNIYSQKTSLRPEIFQWSLASMKNTITKYHVLCKQFQFLCSFIKYEIKLWPICEVNIHIISSRKNLKGQKSLCKAMKMKLYWFPMKSSKEKKGKKGGLLNVCLIK